MDLDSNLVQLESAQLVRRVAGIERAFQFKHNLTQETSYQSLLLKRRKDIHRRVAAAYEHIYAENPDEYAAMLAQHYYEAGEEAKTVQYATLAGDAAARVYANTEAVTNFTLALQAARKIEVGAETYIDLFSKRGRALELSGHYDSALGNYQELENLGLERDEPRLVLSAVMARATIHSIPSHYHDSRAAQTLSDQALVIARQLGDKAAESKILWNLMLLYSHADVRYREAATFGEQSLAIAREHGLREQLAYTLNDLSPLYVAIGKPELGLAYCEEARAMWHEFNNLPMLSDNLGYGVMNHLQMGELSIAVQDYQEALKVNSTIGNAWGEAFSRTWAGAAFRELGQIQEAIRVMEEGVRIGAQSFPVTLSVTRADLARLYGDLGEIDQGIKLADLAFETAERSFRAFLPFAAGALVHLLLLKQDLSSAKAILEKGYGAIDPTNSVAFYGNPVFLADGEFGLALGDYDRALASADRVISERRSLRLHLLLPNALHLKGRALIAQSRVEEALTALDEAKKEAEAMGAPWSLWRILADLGQVEASRGNQVESESLNRRAGELVREIVKQTPSDLRKSFLGTPEVRALLVTEGEA